MSRKPRSSLIFFVVEHVGEFRMDILGCGKIEAPQRRSSYLVDGAVPSLLPFADDIGWDPQCLPSLPC